MTSKKKITLSVIGILVILAMMLGITYAWFTDVETIGTKFEAGVLDITVGDDVELTFENLRPMASEDAFMNWINTYEIDAALSSSHAPEGYDPTPVYVQEFTINNEGTLPVNLKLALVDAEVPADCKIPNIVDNGVGGVKVGDPAEIACDNGLGVDGVLELVLLKKVNGAWEKVTTLGVDALKDGYIVLDGEGNEVVLPAGESTTTSYALGAYLNADAGNEYQGKHYHATLKVLAAQTDEGATFAA